MNNAYYHIFFYNFHNYTFQCQFKFFVVTLLSKIAKIHTSLCNTDNFVFCRRFENSLKYKTWNLENLEFHCIISNGIFLSVFFLIIFFNN